MKKLAAHTDIDKGGERKNATQKKNANERWKNSQFSANIQNCRFEFATNENVQNC